MGDDLLVVNAARVSFDKESEWEEVYDGPWPLEILSEKDEKLISFLARNNHWTPFSHPQITLRETVPIFIARQRFKHTVGFSYNEISRRYVDDEVSFYTPAQWRKRAENKKQGSSDETIDLSKIYTFTDDPIGMFDDYTLEELYTEHLERSEFLYKRMVQVGVCPEQARMVLPQSMYTSYYVTGSLAAFARAYNLRSKPDAQKEIQELAAQWNEIISPLFPVSWAALTVPRTHLQSETP